MFLPNTLATRNWTYLNLLNASSNDRSIIHNQLQVTKLPKLNHWGAGKIWSQFPFSTLKIRLFAQVKQLYVPGEAEKQDVNSIQIARLKKKNVLERDLLGK